MMDSFEFSKIAGSVLAALLLIVGFRTYLDQHPPHFDPKSGYTLPEPSPDAAAPAADGKTAAAAPAFNPAEIVGLLAKANADNGKKTFGQCLNCHKADTSSPSKAAPNLWNVVNRKLAARDDFTGYSKGMKEKGGEWTYEHLAGFLHKPAAYLPGTAMKFGGVAKPQELADLIAYIRTLSDSPAPLPN